MHSQFQAQMLHLFNQVAAALSGEGTEYRKLGPILVIGQHSQPQKSHFVEKPILFHFVVDYSPFVPLILPHKFLEQQFDCYYQRTCIILIQDTISCKANSLFLLYINQLEVVHTQLPALSVRNRRLQYFSKNPTYGRALSMRGVNNLLLIAYCLLIIMCLLHSQEYKDYANLCIGGS